jgi:hypothetical protein
MNTLMSDGCIRGTRRRVFDDEYHRLTAEQKQEICFPWDSTEGGWPLRQRLSNHWQVTRPCISSDFFTSAQRALLHKMFWDCWSPSWHARIARQILEDTGSTFGKHHSVALIGEPEDLGKQVLFTGRHLALRTNGNGALSPLFFGHNCPPHEESLFWSVAQAAMQFLRQLNPHQQSLAISPTAPDVVSLLGRVGVTGRPEREYYSTPPPGLLATELHGHQRHAALDFISSVTSMFQRSSLHTLGAEALMFDYTPTYIGFLAEQVDGIYPTWWIANPSFCWYFQGLPHVHVWANWFRTPCLAVPGVFLHPEHDRLE